MASPTAKVARIGEGRADLEIPKDSAERSGLREGDELFVFAPGAGVMLLAREAGKRGFLVGDLDTLSLSEVLGFVTSTIRTGTLVLQGRSARRRILFADGQVIFAASSEPAERLGPVLWRAGLVTAGQLDEWEPRMSPSARLGKLLVDAGVLTPAQLYRGMQLQVREILLAAFTETAGEFAFIEGESAELNTVKLPERTRDLALEGMSRAERIKAWRLRFDPAAAPQRIDEAGVPAGREQEALWARLDGETSLRDAMRATRLGEFAALRALEELVAAGLVDPGPVPAPAPKPPPRRAMTPAARPAAGAGPLQIYREAIRRIGEELESAGAAGRLASYFEGLAPQFAAVFAKVAIGPGGELDLDAVMANAERLQKGPMGRAMALEALDAFVSFALFDARNVLPPPKALELSREVTRMLRGR